MITSTKCSILLSKQKGSRQYNFQNDDRPERTSSEQHNQFRLGCLNWDSFFDAFSSSHSTLGAFFTEYRKNQSFNGLVEYLNPALFATIANREDNPSFFEAMNCPEAGGFIAAMEAEILTFIKHDVFDIVK